MPSSVALPVGLVVNEWVTNAIKYAFPAGRSGTILVHLARARDSLRIEVRDDGIGMDEAAPEGVGSRLIPSLVAAVNGRVELLIDGGAIRSVIVPQ